MDLQSDVLRLLAEPRCCYGIADRECVYANFKPYQRLLLALAAMPNSPIEPNSIVETWHSTAHGMVILAECSVAQQAIHLWIPRMSDFLDLRFLAQINQHCDQAQFVVIESDEQAIIVLANRAEQAQLNDHFASLIHPLGLEAQTEQLLATTEQRLALHDYQALIEQTTVLLKILPSAPLYTVRGRAAYESGQTDIAWLDWAAAAQLGTSTIYADMQARYHIY